MKSVVVIGPDEAIRMLALAVLARPENAGRCVGGVEMEISQADNRMLSCRVIVCDTPAEAATYGFTPPPGAQVSPKPAQVLQMVRGADTSQAAPPIPDPAATLGMPIDEVR